MTNGVAVRGGTGLWRCACGRVNMDAPHCEMCLADAPAASPLPVATTVDASPMRQLWDQAESLHSPVGLAHPPVVEEAQITEPAPSATRAGGRATRTVVGIILANVVVQVTGLAVTRHMRPEDMLGVSLAVALMFYGATAVWVTLRADVLGVRPRWLQGRTAPAVGRGLAFGLVAGLTVTLVASAAAQHPVVDPMAGLLAAQPLVVLALGALVMAVLAPLVEELVFRGFLAEALRGRGRPVAMLVSAAAFSLAHLRFAQFRYFAMMGLALGALYWRRGLVCSIAGHAAFNATLLGVAVVLAHGPATTLAADGIAFRLPGRWHQVKVAHADAAAMGPGVAQLSVSHGDLPAGVSLDAQQVSAALASGRLSSAVPDSTLDPASVQVVQLAAGPVVRFRATVHGHDDQVVLMVTGTRLVAIDFFANGSAAAAQDFEAMLASLHTAALPSP